MHSSGWQVRRFIVVSGFVALLVVVMVWNRPSPDSAPAVTPPDHDPVEAPAEAVLFQEVLSVSDAVVRDGVWYAIDIWAPRKINFEHVRRQPGKGLQDRFPMRYCIRHVDSLKRHRKPGENRWHKRAVADN